MKKLILAIAMSLAALGVGCGRHSYSAPVGVNLSAASGDVAAGTLSSDKLITLETGNPYGGFLSAARTKLGKDPSNVEVGGLTLFLGADSQGVTALEQVFAGQVDVLFLMIGTGASYSVGHLTNFTGPGPVNAAVDFDPSKVVGQDHFALMSGSFRVVVRGAAATGFATRGASATLQNTFTFRAVE